MFRGSPTTADLADLIDEVTQDADAPNYIVTDRSGQFRGAFRHALRARGIQHARGDAGPGNSTQRLMRLLWSLKRWWRVSLMVPSTAAIQKRLGAYATWHNPRRTHEAHDKPTPSEVAQGLRVPEPVRYTEGGEFEPRIHIRRQHVGGDPRLRYPAIKVKLKHRSAAQQSPHSGAQQSAGLSLHNKLLTRRSSSRTPQRAPLRSRAEREPNAVHRHAASDALQYRRASAPLRR